MIQEAQFGFCNHVFEGFSDAKTLQTFVNTARMCLHVFDSAIMKLILAEGK